MAEIRWPVPSTRPPQQQLPKIITPPAPVAATPVQTIIMWIQDRF